MAWLRWQMSAGISPEWYQGAGATRTSTHQRKAPGNQLEPETTRKTRSLWKQEDTQRTKLRRMLGIWSQHHVFTFRAMRCSGLELCVPPRATWLKHTTKDGQHEVKVLASFPQPTRLSPRQLSRTIRLRFFSARLGRDIRNQRLRYHVVMTVKCHVFWVLSCASCHCDYNACDDWSSVCTESVHSTVCHCARVALVITVGSSAHAQAGKQLNEHQMIHARNKDKTQR